MTTPQKQPRPPTQNEDEAACGQACANEEGSADEEEVTVRKSTWSKAASEYVSNLDAAIEDIASSLTHS
ncbi:hypothetical protein GCM10023165_08510 [Variovorax defluvii]|uniref:DUF3606 domain-containing protein n=1 Tax=Variovorax defluvii TaxID=913761 RepID=A0ABP8H2B3_9BURK